MGARHDRGKRHDAGNRVDVGGEGQAQVGTGKAVDLGEGSSKGTTELLPAILFPLPWCYRG